MTRYAASIVAMVMLGTGIPAYLLAQSEAPRVEAELTLDRDPIYVGEPFALILTVRSSNVRLGRHMELLGLPDRDKLEHGTPEELPVRREVRDRAIHEVRRYRFPVRAPRADTFHLDVTLRARKISQSRTMLGQRWIEQPLAINVPPLDFAVKPIPIDSRPADFSGAVGELAFTVEADPLDVAVGDLIRITLDVQGEAHLTGITPPQLTVGPEFRSYPARTIEDTPRRLQREQVIVPLSTNATVIPELTFTYFDPRREAFVTARQGPFRVRFHAQREMDPIEIYQPQAPAGPTPTPQGPAPLRAAPRTDADREYNTGTLHLARREFGHAVLHLLRARRLAPNDTEVTHNLALAQRGAGIASTEAERDMPTAVVVVPTAGRIAPAAGAWSTLNIAAGTPVRIEETTSGWVMVTVDNNSAWVPRASVTDL